MDGNKKEGVSVKEIEAFAKKHRYEVFLCLLFFFAGIFSLFGSFGRGWCLLFAMAGAILGALLPIKMEHIVRKTVHFGFKQDKTLQIVLGVVALIVAFIIPFVVFLLVGVAGGRALHQMANETSR